MSILTESVAFCNFYPDRKQFSGCNATKTETAAENCVSGWENASAFPLPYERR
jgi:hypothetical protein